MSEQVKIDLCFGKVSRYYASPDVKIPLAVIVTEDIDSDFLLIKGKDGSVTRLPRDKVELYEDGILIKVP